MSDSALFYTDREGYGGRWDLAYQVMQQSAHYNDSTEVLNTIIMRVKLESK